MELKFKCARCEGQLGYIWFDSTKTPRAISGTAQIECQGSQRVLKNVTIDYCDCVKGEGEGLVLLEREEYEDLKNGITTPNDDIKIKEEKIDELQDTIINLKLKLEEFERLGFLTIGEKVIKAAEDLNEALADLNEHFERAVARFRDLYDMNRGLFHSIHNEIEMERNNLPRV